VRPKDLLKEPLLHFLLIGAALFLCFDGGGAGSLVGKPRIVVTSGRIEHLAAAYASAWRRPPNEVELKGLIDDWVQEEIAVREAVAAGLDRDDAIVRRRLRQKFEVMAEEDDGRDAPTQADLAAYLRNHADRFTPPATVSFDQIVLDLAGSADVERVAALAKTALARAAEPATLGRASMLRGHVEAARMDLVAREFGAAFADRLASLPRNEWSGPLRSAFGFHLVRVESYAPGEAPPLERVTAAVAREWENERRLAARAESFRKLRERYDVVVEDVPAPTVAAR
jgi:hypothetical protein